MRKLSLPYFFWLLVFVIFPLILIVLLSLQEGKSFDLLHMKWTLDHYEKFFSPMYLNILARSIKFAVLSTIACLIVGYPIAYFISQLPENKRDFYIVLILIPMWMNFLLRTYAWITLLGNHGILNNLLGLLGLGPFSLMYNQGAIFVGMIYNFLPFMVLPIYTVLLKMDKDLIEAARDLGATNGMVFRKVVFPLSLPGVTSGIGLVFIPAISTFVIPGFLGGNKYPFIGNFIEQQFRFTGNWSFGSALSVSLIVILILFILIGALVNKSRLKGRDKQIENI